MIAYRTIVMKRVFSFLLILAAAGAAFAQAETAQLFEDAAIAREEAARIWEGLGERIRAAEAWGEAAVSWERAAKAWDTAGDEPKANSAWARFRAAIEKRDQADIRLEPVAGDRQSVRVGRLSDSLVVRVTDKTGRPIGGVGVLFDITSRPSRTDGARLEGASARTDSLGMASVRLRAGTTAGAYSLLATVPDLAREPAIFSLTATASAAAKLEIVSGNNQVLKVNQRAIAPLVVRVTDLYGNPAAGARVSFRIVSAPDGAVGQSVSVDEIKTDATGMGGVRFQSGHLGGSYIVLVESENLEGSPSKFELIVRQTIPTLKVVGYRIEGSSDTGSLAAGSTIKIGDQFLLPDLGRLFRDEVHRLYATGRFDDVTAGIEETSDSEQVIAVFRVIERPTIGTVALTGSKRVKEADLRGVLGISEGSFYSPAAIERSRTALREKLDEEGYLRASVAAETSGANGKINVLFRITEGEKVKIGRMNLIGNKFFSDWNLNWHMKTGSGRVYKEAEFEADRQKILGRYLEKGFLSASMEDPVIRYDDRGRMILDIMINEGPRYKLGEITFAGNTALSDAQLRSLMAVKPGTYFRARKFFESIEKMRTQTARHGYAEARVVPQEKLDSARGVADFNIRIIEGPVLYLARIEVEGNTKTQEKIIRREINLRPGARLDGEEIEQGRKRLEALGFFEPQSVRMDLRPDERDTARRVLSVKVAEGKTGQFQFGGGYSSVDKLVGFLSLTKKNFDPFDLWTFTGAGQEISLSAEYGGRKNSYSMSWTEPYFRNRPISVGFDAYNTFQEREGFDWRRRGGAVRLSHRYGPNGRLSYKYGIESIEILDVTNSAPTDVQTEVGFPRSNNLTRQTASLTTGYTRNSRDDNFFPTAGSVFEISNQLAGRFFGGNVSFNRPTISYSQFRKGFSNHVIAVRGQYSTISNFFERDNPIPTGEKYYLGGANTVRGYRERSIQVYTPTGTLLGPGRSYFLGNAEYRIPFTDDKSISMAFFYDVGGVFDGEYEFEPGDLISGLGAGVRFNTPLGPIRLDYGYGLDFPNKGRGQIHFSIGQAF